MDAFFLDVPPGRRFCLLHLPADGSTPRAALLYLHPFAEELNRSRRMAALQSRRLAAAGYAVLQCDLFGCGDSDGDFGDATWTQWVADAQAALDWLRARCAAPVWLWGLRAGCLLAAEVLRRNDDIAGLLLWQPQFAGKPALRQFLRIKLAEQMLDGSGTAAEDLRAILARGESVEIAGYRLSPGMAEGLEGAELNLPASVLRIESLEVAAGAQATGAQAAISPALAARTAQWAAAGHAARAGVVSGAQFWQMADPEDAPGLLDATLLALADAAH